MAGEKPEWSEVSSHSLGVKCYYHLWDTLHLRDNVLYRKWEDVNPNKVEWHIVLPKALLPLVFEQLHCSVTAGHLGTKKTYEKVKQRFFWYKMKADIEHLVRICDTCATCKGPGKVTKAPMKIYTVGYPLERIALDIMSGLPRSTSGNKHILVIGDYFTKWADAYPIKDMEAKTVAKVLVERFICPLGVPNEIHTDRSQQLPRCPKPLYQ